MVKTLMNLNNLLPYMLIKILLQWQPKLPLLIESHLFFLDSFENEDYLREKYL